MAYLREIERPCQSCGRRAVVELVNRVNGFQWPLLPIMRQAQARRAERAGG